jgi:3-isopropylmalate/(R)-2-methylmalate dehydratase small subunit
MQAFTTLTSRVIPLAMKDVDTDMIIPAQYLTQTDRDGYGAFLFKRLREQGADFVFNQPQYADAKILLTESNFGCGSSREHAVWALQQAGIRVIIAESFSDIFYNNAQKNGLLLISLAKETIAALFAKVRHAPDIEVSVDLVNQTIQPGGDEAYSFIYDPFRKECLLKGYDDMDYLLQALPDIERYYERQSQSWQEDIRDA